MTSCHPHTTSHHIEGIIRFQPRSVSYPSIPHCQVITSNEKLITATLISSEKDVGHYDTRCSSLHDWLLSMALMPRL